MAIAVTGLWLLTGGVRDMTKGDFLTIIAAFGYACHIVVSGKYIEKRLDPLALNFQQFFTAGLLSLVAGLIFHAPFGIVDSIVYWQIVFFALFPTLFAFIAQLKAQQFVSPLRVSLIFVLEPVFAALFSWTAGGEPFTIPRAVGGILICAAMALSSIVQPH